MELISVIIPTHFRPERLAKAVKSVQRQTWSNLEIIIVSDGHDEETDQLVFSISKKDDRIKYYWYEPSRGGNHARNIGVKNSSANYIAFLDDDDVWYPTKLEAQMQILIKENVGLVGCGIRVIHTSKGISYRTIFKERGDCSTKILKTNIVGSTSCVLIRKEAIDTCGLFDEDMPARQDYDLWIRICQKYKIDFVESVQLDYFVYDEKGKGQQISKSLSKYLTAHQILTSKYDYLYKQLGINEQITIKANRFLDIAHRAVEVGDRKTAREYGRKSWNVKHTKAALYYLFFNWIPYGFLVRLKAVIS